MRRAAPTDEIPSFQSDSRSLWLRGATAAWLLLWLSGCASAPVSTVGASTRNAPIQVADVPDHSTSLSSGSPVSFSSAGPRITEVDGWTHISMCRGYTAHSAGPVAAPVVGIAEVAGGVMVTCGIGKTSSVSLCQRTTMSCSGQRAVGEVRGVSGDQSKAFLPFSDKVGEDCTQGVVFC